MTGSAGGDAGGACPFAGGLSRGAGRRGFLVSAGAGLVAAAAHEARADTAASAEAMGAEARGAEARGAEAAAKGIVEAARTPSRAWIEPFRGTHQGGIATALQNHTVFAAFDMVATRQADLVALLQHWTSAAESLTRGAPIETLPPAPGTDGYGNPVAAKRGAPIPVPLVDIGDALGLGPARLTLTFGFGPSLFAGQGNDRLGLARRRPAALIDLPGFSGDQLQPARTGGDLSVQACADDPQVAFHAIRQLANIAAGTARLRWMQTGFAANAAASDTPRNLMGFKDGTQNPQAAPVHELVHGAADRRSGGGAVRDNPGRFDDVVWVDAGDAGWMRGGTYVVTRRIRIALEHWDRTPVDYQEQVVGRHKLSGAPLGMHSEFDPLDLARTDEDGNPVIPLDAHVRLATAISNSGARMLRRSYSYNDGASFTAERWPPWRQGMEFDAGLLFVCYQRDPRDSFVRIFDQLARMDAMNQFVTHTGGGLFACPRGARDGEFIGQDLFEAA